MLLLFALFVPLVTSDSIILQNDCKRTSEQCFITLEVIKGEPAKDCSIFSTVDRMCSIGINEIPTEVPSDEGIQVTHTDSGTVISWTGQKVQGNGTETNTLTASSIWQRIKRQVKGQVANCTCTPVRRQKRQVDDSSSESTTISSPVVEEFSFYDSNGCLLGFRETSKSFDPSTNPTLQVVSASAVEICALFCNANIECENFAFDSSESLLNCVYLKQTDNYDGNGPFTVYEKC